MTHAELNKLINKQVPFHLGEMVNITTELQVYTSHNVYQLAGFHKGVHIRESFRTQTELKDYVYHLLKG